MGTLALQIPRVRTGSLFPSWLEPRRRSERALVAVVAEAYVQGVSTRIVEALAQSLGITTLSKSEVSRLCAVLDEEVALFRMRRLDAEYPSLWLDAHYEHVRDGGRVIKMAVSRSVRTAGRRRARGARDRRRGQRAHRPLAGVPAGAGRSRATRVQLVSPTPTAG